jgi:hypothetical protein
MSDAVLTPQDRQEAISRAYAAAIAAGAGYVTYVPDLDRDSVDIGFCAGGAMRPNVHAQLKATINLRKSGEALKFQLKKKNYDDLRVPTIVPRIIVVLDIPRKEPSWLNISVQLLRSSDVLFGFLCAECRNCRAGGNRSRLRYR